MSFGSFYCFLELSRRFAMLFGRLLRCVPQQKRHPPSERTDAPSFGVAVCFFVLSAVNQIINPVISAEAAAASATTIRGQLKYASITATAVPTAAVILLPVE